MNQKQSEIDDLKQDIASMGILPNQGFFSSLMNELSANVKENGGKND